ncbi:MAG: MFS transporter [Hyalangium sp.]|uniref:MFS transporter n=1 Tax=Hyalangium sp. TaxID=2028555 RepID=UPI00389A558F
MTLGKTWLILLLAITLSGDTMLTVALIWTALSSSQSFLPLGLTLALMSAVPYTIQLLLPRMRNWIAHENLRAFAAARFAGLLVALTGLLLPSPLSIWGLYGIAGAFTVTAFIAQQSLESTMAGLALRKVLSAKEASRISQAGIQLGAFVGGALGGLLHERAGIKWTFAVLIGTLAVGALIPALLRGSAEQLESTHAGQGAGGASHQTTAAQRADTSRSIILWLALIGIAVLTVHLGAYNYLIPIILQKEKQWAVSDYGLVSAAAGFGALLATMVVAERRGERWNVTLSVFAIAIADYGLCATGSVVFAAGLAFMIGYSFNTLRIWQRKLIFENVTSDQEGVEWAGRTTIVFQLLKAAVPLALALALDRMGTEQAGPMFVLTGIGIAASLLLLMTRQVRLVTLAATTK